MLASHGMTKINSFRVLPSRVTIVKRSEFRTSTLCTLGIIRRCSETAFEKLYQLFTTTPISDAFENHC